MNYEEAKTYMKYHPEAWLDRDGSGEGYICPLCNSGSGRNGTGLSLDPNSKDGTHWHCWNGECEFYGDMIQLAAEKNGIVMPKYDGGVMTEETAELYRKGFEAARAEYGIQVSPDGVYFAGKKKEARKAKYKVMLDTTEGTQKPDGWAARNRSKEPERVGWYTLEEIAQALCKGGTVQPCTGTYWLHPTKTNPKTGEPIEKFKGEKQQLIAKDFDNDHTENGVKVPNEKQITIEEALAICKENGFIPCLGYRTFSDPEYPYDKFRLVWALDRELDIEEIGKNNFTKIDNLFVDMFDGRTDAAADGDLNRLFFGTNDKPFHYDDTAVVSTEEIMRRINTKTAEEEVAEVDPEEEVKSVSDYLESFWQEIFANGEEDLISTGFPFLDELLGGGLTHALYTLGAISGLGKTTFLMQMAEHIAASGKDVLMFSFEMSRFDLMGRSLSRHTAEIQMEKRGADRTEKAVAGAVSLRDLTEYKWKDNPEQIALVGEANERYGSYAERLHIIRCNRSYDVHKIRRVVDNHIAKTGRKPIVLVDYLQIIKPYTDPENTRKQFSDQQNVTENIATLKEISDTHKIPLFVISSLNRQSYSTGEVDMEDFKQAGEIEYYSDVLLALQFSDRVVYGSNSNAEAKKQKERDFRKEQFAKPVRDVEIKVIKSRKSTPGKSVKFFHYGAYSFFVEKKKEVQSDLYPDAIRR